MHISRIEEESGYLEMDLGPMFSGKSTNGVSRLVTYSDVGFKCSYINHSLDKRITTRVSGVATTHHSAFVSIPDKIDCYKVMNLGEVDVSAYQVIHIDEGQFYPDVYETVIDWVDKQQKIIYISALDGDYRRLPFINNVLHLIPYADVVVKKNAFCHKCIENGRRHPKLAPFSYRLVKSEEQTLAGGKDKYSAYCRGCYNSNS